ncbi:hypothetical protein Bbelb_243660 [Branchiostoma belcheri]|nr:hypothetical protein Bbelb_243660 [Branchiostoma belcheri]
MWLRNNFPIKESEDFQFLQEGNIYCLVLREAYPEDAGLYTCRAINSVDVVSCSAELRVEEVAEVQFLGSIYCLVLREAYLNPEDAGLGHQIKRFDSWHCFNSVDVVSFSAKLCVEEVAKVQFLGNIYCLVLREAYPEDAGLYTCRAINSVDVSSQMRKVSRWSILKLTDEEGEPMVHPEFQQKIRPCEVTEDDPARMDCKVTGVPEPEVTWYKDGLEITQDPDYQFLFEELKLYKDGLEITQDPEYQFLFEESKLYKDGVEITQDPEYQFLFEDEESMCLIVPVASKKHEGLYSCLAGNKLGQVACYARLTVKEKSRRPAHPGPPSFLTTLADVFAVEGSQACFTCTVVGNPDPNIEWLLDSRVLKPTPDFSMSFENDMAKLILKTAYPEDQGLYTCKASNSYGETSCSARLHVSEEYTLDTTHAMPPKFIHTFHDTDAMEGREVRFDCRIIGIPQPKVAWYLHNRWVLYLYLYNWYTTALQCNTPALQAQFNSRIIGIPQPKVAWYLHNRVGKYALIPQPKVAWYLHNRVGKYALIPQPKVAWYLHNSWYNHPLAYTNAMEGQEYALIPQPKVAWYLHNSWYNHPLAYTNAMEGQEYALIPQPKVAWYLHNREVQDSLEYRIFQANDQHSLVIPEVFPDDEGEVVCKAVNSLGEISCSAELFVDEEEPTITRQSREGSTTTVAAAVGVIPNFVQRLQNCAVSEGETATFRCQITGDPRPKVMWFHKKREVTSARRVKMSYTEEGVATLVITGASKGDIGVYACVANSPAGKATCVAKLHVETEVAPKPPYGMPRVSSRTGTSLILSWNPPPPQQDSDSPISYIIEFRELFQKVYNSPGSLQDSRWQVKAKNVRETSYLVDRLQEDCVYFFRISTENDFGVSEPSEESKASNIHEGSDSEDEDVLGRPGLVRQGSVKRRGPPGAPEFLSLPEDCFTLEGGTAVFSCMLSTRPAVSTVQWLWMGKAAVFSCMLSTRPADSTVQWLWMGKVIQGQD